ncbi:RHTO0S17e02828g3_1 [Rhodotorula toruloides]|uniref:RHTO0S17e02828g3_1 n=1 Tax=Rhodotorula toruloides TaxID=5286 RepID=A0A061BGA4_RHOTO|nr:RHTO0S17e02828g3_1 [Rhodotorula toruloides]
MHDCSNQLDRTACLSLSPHLLPDEHVVQEHATCRCFRTHASRAFAGSRRPLRHVRTSHRSAHGRRMGLMWTKLCVPPPSRVSLQVQTEETGKREETEEPEEMEETRETRETGETRKADERGEARETPEARAARGMLMR